MGRRQNFHAFHNIRLIIIHCVNEAHLVDIVIMASGNDSGFNVIEDIEECA